MANGQQIAEENVLTFMTWSLSKKDSDFRNMAVRGSLSRTEIAAECGFAKSALRQNPRIKSALRSLEDGLRKRGILPPVAAEAATGGDQEEFGVLPTPQSSQSGMSAMDARRLSRLETDNAALKAEVSELKRQLGKFTIIQEVLSETGRMPR
jgi:hypothetical protein